MKAFTSNILHLVLLGVMASLSTGLWANPTEDSIRPLSFRILTDPIGRVIQLNMEPLSSEDVTIYLKDEEGNLLYQNKVKSGKEFNQRFNMSLLEIGSYSLHLVGESAYSIQPLAITREGMILKPSLATQVKAPQFEQSGNLLSLKMATLGNPELSISIIDKEGQSVFSQNLAGANEIERIYNLKKLESGEYEVLVFTEYQMYTHPITIK